MIKLISKIVFVLVLICSVINTYGQKKMMGEMMGKMMAKEMDRHAAIKTEMKEKELIIVLMEGDADASDFHRRVASNYNDFIKELAEEYLAFFKRVKFRKVSEIAVMTDRNEYYFLCYNEVSMSSGTGYAFNVFDEIVPGKEDKFLKRYKKLNIDNNTEWMRLEIYAEENGKTKIVTGINMPEVMPAKWNMIYALSTLKNTYGELPKSPSQLLNKNKVLLICKDDLHKKMEVDEIRKYYKNKYEVVSRAEYAKAIERKVDKYIYVVVAPLMMSPTNPSTGVTVSTIIYANMYVDCPSGLTVGLTTISGSVGVIGAGASKKINKDSLKKIHKQLSAYM